MRAGAEPTILSPQPGPTTAPALVDRNKKMSRRVETVPLSRLECRKRGLSYDCGKATAGSLLEVVPQTASFRPVRTWQAADSAVVSACTTLCPRRHKLASHCSGHNASTRQFAAQESRHGYYC